MISTLTLFFSVSMHLDQGLISRKEIPGTDWEQMQRSLRILAFFTDTDYRTDTMR